MTDVATSSADRVVVPVGAGDNSSSRPVGREEFDPAPVSVAPPSRFVYAIGRVEARFPSLGVEKEFAQVTGRAETAGLTDRETAYTILSDPANRYLVRQLCWVLTIEGMDTYLLIPRHGSDLDLLAESVRYAPSGQDLDVVIGTLGPLAAPDTCNGLVVPMVLFDNLYSFNTDEFLREIPKPDNLSAEAFDAAARELLARVGQLADNSGATDEHRALNYLAMRYPAIYARATEQFARNGSLTSVDVRPSRLSGVRKVVNVVFTYTDRASGVQEQFAAKVDVTEKFPFLVAPLSPYYSRG